MIRRWRPSLRMARREVLRHKTRTLLSVILIMVPVLVATVVALYAHNLRYEGERACPRDHGWSRRAGEDHAVHQDQGGLRLRRDVHPARRDRPRQGRQEARRTAPRDRRRPDVAAAGRHSDRGRPDVSTSGAAERRHGLPPVPRRRRPVGGRALPRHRREGAREGRRGRDQEEHGRGARPPRRRQAPDRREHDARGRDGPARRRPVEARDLVRRDDGGDRRPLPPEPGGAEGTA